MYHPRFFIDFKVLLLKNTFIFRKTFLVLSIEWSKKECFRDHP